MNEPPIASPFGSSRLQPKKSAPLLLKILVGAQLFYVALSFVFAFMDAAQYPTAILYAVPLSGLSSAAVALLYVGLLRGQKVCWWLFQCVVLITTGSVVHRLMGGQSLAGPIVPSWIRHLFFALEIVLEVYLLTPTMRNFFFGQSEKPSSWDR